MASDIFDKETFLDITVNLIPFGILMIFIGLFAVLNPWGFDPVWSTIQFAIVGAMVVLLLVLTYFSAKAIEGDARANEGHEDSH